MKKYAIGFILSLIPYSAFAGPQHVECPPGQHEECYGLGCWCENNRGGALTGMNISPQSTALQGQSAKIIFDLIQASGHANGILEIVGYVTERANPAVLFNEAYLSSNNRTSRLVATPDQLQSAVDVLETAGVHRAVISGGTTYVKYTAKVECVSADSCIVE